jgi:hypothetical protein
MSGDQSVSLKTFKWRDIPRYKMLILLLNLMLNFLNVLPQEIYTKAMKNDE